MSAPNPISIAEALRLATAALAQTASDSPRLEAEVLLGLALERPRTYLIAWSDQVLPENTLQRFRAALERRIQGEPLAYITGQREFWSLSLRVSPATLIPRPETELLVERALELIPTHAHWTLADLGTGSGAIALAMAKERPACRIIACDISEDALAIARENARQLGIDNVEFHSGAWCEALPSGLSLDLIVSNPPYVATGDPHLQQGDLPWEPVSALVSGSDGLDDIRILARQAPAHLQRGGALLLEHGPDQGPAIRDLLHRRGFIDIRTHPDLEQRERITEGVMP